MTDSVELPPAPACCSLHTRPGPRGGRIRRDATPLTRYSGQIAAAVRDRPAFAKWVRQPAEQARFTGVLVVEWLNVSSGDDAAPDYTYLGAERVRRGQVWCPAGSLSIGLPALPRVWRALG